MNDVYEALLFYEDMPPRKREAMRERLQEDPDLADALARWREMEQAVAEKMRESVPDRRLLVLYALEQDDHRGLLSTQEQMALDEARGDIERAIRNHPALEDVVARIQEEHADFNATWEAGPVEAPDAEASDASAEAPEGVDVVAASDADRRDATSRRADRDARRSQSRQDGQVWRRLAGVAMVAVAAVLVVFLWPREPDLNVVEIAAGEMQTIELVDGSTVRLVGETRLTYAQATGEAFDRRVTLDYGKALFNVADVKGERRFVVRTPTARATVLGTRFGVETAPEVTEVTLASGKVTVGDADGNRSVELQPGQQSRVERDADPSSPASVDLLTELEWSGMMIFRKTPVEDIATRLASLHDVEITVDAALEGEPVSGEFDQTRPPKQVLQVVATALDARLEGNADKGFRLVATQ